MKPKLISVNDDYKWDGINCLNCLPWHEISAECDDLLFLEDNIKYLSLEQAWPFLSRNYHAIPILEKNKEKVNFYNLGMNTHPRALNYLEQNLMTLFNKSYVHSFDLLFRNSSEKAINLIEKILLMDDPKGRPYMNRPHVDCSMCKKEKLKCSSCMRLHMENLALNKSAVHILETFFKNEPLNGVRKISNLDIYINTFSNKFVISKYSDDDVMVALERFFKNLASNKNASTYLIELINRYVEQCLDLDLFQHPPGSRYTSDDSMKLWCCGTIEAMLKNKENEKMVEEGKMFIRKIKHPRLISDCMEVIVEGNHIDLIEEFYHMFLNVQTELEQPVDTNDPRTWAPDDLIVQSFWACICAMEHPRAMEILIENITFINSLVNTHDMGQHFAFSLSENPEALLILERYEDKYFDVDYAFYNPNEDIYPLIKKHFNEIDWADMFDYSYCNDIIPEIFPQDGLDSWKYKRQHVSIRKYMNKLYEDGFKHPFLEEHMKANSYEFCRNNMSRVNVNNLNMYPASFWTGLFYKIDYEAMKEENSEFRSELTAHVYHPARLQRMADSFQIEFSDYLDSLE